MIFTSLKENTDILVGKIPFSHAHNDCMLIKGENDHLWVLTSDGGINKFERDTLKLKDHTTVRTMTTSFKIDKENIWVGSANHGLLRVNKDNLKKQKEFKLPLGEFDRAKVVKTCMAINKEKIWYSMQYRGYEGLVEFDTKKEKVSRVFDLTSRLSPAQIKNMCKIKNTLWIGTDKAIIEFSIPKGQIVNVFPIQKYLPQGPDQMDLLGNDIIISGVTGAHLFSTSERRVVATISTGNIQTVYVKRPKIYLGSNVGFVEYNLESEKRREFDDLFNEVDRHGNLIKDVFVPAEVSAIWIENSNAFVGSSFGRVTISKTEECKKGHIVISWINYFDMWRNVDFGLYLKNSFIICGISMVFAMIFATMAAYSISRFDFPGSRLFSIAILATQMVPGIMFLIPIYSMFVKFNEYTGIPLKGTYYGMIFMYSTFFIPFSIWILRGFFAAIPIELEEAARIDGCSPWQVFWHVVLPLAIPGIIATGIYVFLTAWDELMFAWVLTSGDTMTIPVGIRNFVGNYQNRFDLIMAAATVATVPVMVLFFMLQRHIVKGLTAGAVKG
jgi:multiple sugar transport system permease protein